MIRLLPILLLALAACGQPRTTPEAMQEHYRNAGLAQTAVIEGKLDAARDAMRRVATSDPVPTLPAGARPFEDRLRAQARTGAGSADLAAAARATAAMGRACGDCHRAHATGPRFATAAPWTAQGAPVTDAMRRHLWGADQMWNGLIAPSDSAWRMGARALAEPSTYDQLFSHRTDQGRSMRTYADKIRQLGAAAADESDPAARADRYAEVLGTCSACHAAAGVVR